MWGRSHLGPSFREYENRTADSGHRASDLTLKSWLLVKGQRTLSHSRKSRFGHLYLIGFFGTALLLSGRSFPKLLCLKMILSTVSKISWRRPKFIPLDYIACSKSIVKFMVIWKFFTRCGVLRHVVFTAFADNSIFCTSSVFLGLRACIGRRFAATEILLLWDFTGHLIIRLREAKEAWISGEDWSESRTHFKIRLRARAGRLASFTFSQIFCIFRVMIGLIPMKAWFRCFKMQKFQSLLRDDNLFNGKNHRNRLNEKYQWKRCILPNTPLDPPSCLCSLFGAAKTSQCPKSDSNNILLLNSGQGMTRGRSGWSRLLIYL